MLSPERLGDYEIIQLLAAGGMAEIFLARKTGPGGFEKRVVIKRIAKKLLGDREVEAMFLDEARVQALLDHPNIVQIYELGEEKGSYYIAMEFVPGATLRWVIDNAMAVDRPVPLQHALRIISDLLTGLHYAHEKRDAKGRPLGLIHRDISPVNVLVSRAGVAKVCDFGVAKSKLQSVMTRVGIVKGKFRYMAPEQVEGRALDCRADVFAVGSVLWEMLVGRRLFNQDPEEEVVSVIRAGVYPSVLQFRPDLPRAIDRVLGLALNVKPDRRFANAGEFALALEQILRRLPKGSSTVGLAEYIGSELEGTAGLEQGHSIDHQDLALLSGSFVALDPPVPKRQAGATASLPPPQPIRPPTLLRRASVPGKMLAGVLLLPSLAFTVVGLALEGLVGLVRLALSRRAT
ncbi:MAG: serine/threonine protein kinase [Deltaproteobacteria bacterium]|nr:serine/threonine protein kinase [Deltaproteobacteria bacterium]